MTSRCTSQRACAASSAAATCAQIADRTFRVEDALRLQQLLQVGSLDVAHRDREPAVGVEGVVDRHDVRMLQRSGKLRLGQEPLAESLILR